MTVNVIDKSENGVYNLMQMSYAVGTAWSIRTFNGR